MLLKKWLTHGGGKQQQPARRACQHVMCQAHNLLKVAPVVQCSGCTSTEQRFKTQSTCFFFFSLGQVDPEILQHAMKWCINASDVSQTRISLSGGTASFFIVAVRVRYLSLECRSVQSSRRVCNLLFFTIMIYASPFPLFLLPSPRSTLLAVASHRAPPRCRPTRPPEADAVWFLVTPNRGTIFSGHGLNKMIFARWQACELGNGGRRKSCHMYRQKTSLVFDEFATENFCGNFWRCRHHRLHQLA